MYTDKIDLIDIGIRQHKIEEQLNNIKKHQDLQNIELKEQQDKLKLIDGKLDRILGHFEIHPPSNVSTCRNRSNAKKKWGELTDRISVLKKESQLEALEQGLSDDHSERMPGTPKFDIMEGDQRLLE